MGEVIDFSARLHQKQTEKSNDSELGFYIMFEPDFEVGNVSFTLDDLHLELPDPEVVNEYITRLENEITLAPSMEHIRNLIEVCQYNVDWMNAPDWHKDMYERARKYYNEYYGRKDA